MNVRKNEKVCFLHCVRQKTFSQFLRKNYKQNLLLINTELHCVHMTDLGKEEHSSNKTNKYTIPTYPHYQLVQPCPPIQLTKYIEDRRPATAESIHAENS